MMSQYLPMDKFKAIYVVDLCASLCDQARKKKVSKGWTNVHVIEGDACAFTPPEGTATLVTFSYSLSSKSIRYFSPAMLQVLLIALCHLDEIIRIHRAKDFKSSKMLLRLIKIMLMTANSL